MPGDQNGPWALFKRRINMKAYRPYRNFTEMKLAEIEERLLRIESTEEAIERILCKNLDDEIERRKKELYEPKLKVNKLYGLDRQVRDFNGLDTKNGNYTISFRRFKELVRDTFVEVYGSLYIIGQEVNLYFLYDKLLSVCPPDSTYKQLSEPACVAFHRVVWFKIALDIFAHRIRGNKIYHKLDICSWKRDVIDEVCADFNIKFVPELKDKLDARSWCFLCYAKDIYGHCPASRSIDTGESCQEGGGCLRGRLSNFIERVCLIANKEEEDGYISDDELFEEAIQYAIGISAVPCHFEESENIFEEGSK